MVLKPPLFKNPSRLSQALKPVHVQALVSELAIETLDEPVVHWTSWSDEIKLDASLVDPLIEVVAGEFGPVVQSDDHRLSVGLHCLVECQNDRICREALCGLQKNPFPADLIDRSENSESSAIVQPVADEVDAPVLARLRCR